MAGETSISVSENLIPAYGIPGGGIVHEEDSGNRVAIAGAVNIAGVAGILAAFAPLQQYNSAVVCNPGNIVMSVNRYSENAQIGIGDGQVQIYCSDNSNSFSIRVKPDGLLVNANSVSSWLMPVEDGNSGDVISTNGAGIASWVPGSRLQGYTELINTL